MAIQFNASEFVPGPKLDIKKGVVDLSHGAGGRSMHRLIEQLFKKHFDHALLAQQNDAARYTLHSGTYVMATDAHVVSPLFFPGGDIGCLSVHGTINDIAMMGATPLYMTAAFILEEGFPLADLDKIIQSMANAAKQANVAIVSGDTKVVEKGKGDGVFITTTGVGWVPEGITISGDLAKPDDDIIVSGTIGDHGVAILAYRENLQFETTIQSDTASLHSLIANLLSVTSDIHCLRDPTRGGLATTLNEIAHQSKVGMMINESAIPVKEQVSGACELFGLDPLYMANEGKCVIICPKHATQGIMKALHHHPLGREAAVIGRIIQDEHALVHLNTKLGGMRLLDWMMGDQLPRIC